MDRFKVLFLALLLGTTMMACEGTEVRPPPVVPEKAPLDALGGQTGIDTATPMFVDRLLADSRINGYFLNDTFTDENKATMTKCLAIMFTEGVGGTYELGDGEIAPECGDTQGIPTGLGMSQADFDAFLAVLGDTFREHLGEPISRNAAAVNAVVKTADSIAAKVIEDPESNATIYQRLGGKSNIAAVIDLFLAVVKANTAINGFFVGLDADREARLKTCLVRQFCQETGGPCVYGSEVTHPSEPGVAAESPCLDMATVHAGMQDDTGASLAIDDFNALVADVGTALDSFAMGAFGEEILEDAGYLADKQAIVDVLNSLCGDIVAGTGCPASTAR